MPKVVIFFNPHALHSTFPISPKTQMEGLADKIYIALKPVILSQMRGRKHWTDDDLIMEAKLMPDINRNRFQVEVEITATIGEHWEGIEDQTQQLLNEALLDVLIAEELAEEGWKGSVWLLLVAGSFGTTDEAAQRIADLKETRVLPD